MSYEQVIIVRSKTRLEQLIERFNTTAQAEFYIERNGGDFSLYQKEHEAFYRSLDSLVKEVQVFENFKIVDRHFLPSYLFSKEDLVIVLGQDGLVANTAKYVMGQPIVAINPDPETYDGILLPFSLGHFKKRLDQLQAGYFETKSITMAEANFNDGQKLLAFNDFFVGPRIPISARYWIEFENQREKQSSSGVLVSTGAGSTGWMSSVFNMVNGVENYHTHSSHHIDHPLKWESRILEFVVREPFLSRTTSVDICFGEIGEKEKLHIESDMPENGIVFSDGVVSDAIRFSTGMSVEIGIADEMAKLVV